MKSEIRSESLKNQIAGASLFILAGVGIGIGLWRFFVLESRTESSTKSIGDDLNLNQNQLIGDVSSDRSSVYVEYPGKTP